MLINALKLLLDCNREIEFTVEIENIAENKLINYEILSWLNVVIMEGLRQEQTLISLFLEWNVSCSLHVCIQLLVNLLIVLHLLILYLWTIKT